MSKDIFCTKEQTDKTVFYESEDFMALYDIMPVVKGHFLLVPKRHVLDIVELSEEEFKDLQKVLRYVVPKMLQLYGATDGSYDLTSQIGEYSGRSVPHLHMHFIPRKSDDKYQGKEKNIFEDIKFNRTSFTFDDVKKEVAQLRKEFRYTLK